MLAMTLTTTCLGRIGVVEREEKGRAGEGAPVGPAREGPREEGAGPNGWTTVGAIAAEIVARCRAGKKRRGQHVPAPTRSGTPE